MNERASSFMSSVLGPEGSQALQKAASRAPELEAALLPRTIMAWLNVHGRGDFQGAIPGVNDTYLKFVRKNERYSGHISIGDGLYCFGNASTIHLGASIAVAIGADGDRLKPQLKDLDIKRLGKNIDLLVKARVAHSELRKAQRTAKPSTPQPRLHSVPEHVRQAILATPDPHQMSQVIMQHEPELAKIWGGREFLDCDEVSTLLGDGLKHHSIPHQQIVGSNTVGDSHAWVRLHDGTVLDPTEQGTVGGQVVEDFNPSVPTNSTNEGLEKMAIADLPRGRKLSTKDGRWIRTSYSHLLSPEHRTSGYKLIVEHGPLSKTSPLAMRAVLLHPSVKYSTKFRPGEAGQVGATLHGDQLNLEASEVADEHRGGKGVPMYEALYTHAYKVLGAKSVKGSRHSTLASQVHQKLAAKHGLGYIAQPDYGPDAATYNTRKEWEDALTTGENDERFAPYHYTLKSEHRAEAPGPAAAPKAPSVPEAPVAPEATQVSKGPTVTLKPVLPKLPKLQGTHETVQTGPTARTKTPKTATIGVTKSQSLSSCPVCGERQFHDEAFAGCICFKALSKSVKTTQTSSGYTLEFGEDWDRDSILTLIEAMKNHGT